MNDYEYKQMEKRAGRIGLAVIAFVILVMMLCLIVNWEALAAAPEDPYNPTMITYAGCMGVRVGPRYDGVEMYRGEVWLDGYPTPFQMSVNEDGELEMINFLAFELPSTHRIDWIWAYTWEPTFDVFGLGPLVFSCDSEYMHRLYLPVIVR